jgi:hypothetical protein
MAGVARDPDDIHSKPGRHRSGQAGRARSPGGCRPASGRGSGSRLLACPTGRCAGGPGRLPGCGQLTQWPGPSPNPYRRCLSQSVPPAQVGRLRHDLCPGSAQGVVRQSQVAQLPQVQRFGQRLQSDGLNPVEARYSRVNPACRARRAIKARSPSRLRMLDRSVSRRASSCGRAERT